ncbi:MAG: hypothetical protein CBARDCOR_4927 [uncultured Caballeronia sp.]|nr:MAG: hypothetical protein CBARDCOR_4927 [uncultured Caballeronia sp.]
MNTELRNFDAVLFDFADTLFDSRSALLPDVMAQHCADLGMRAAPEDCERWIEQILAYVATPQGQARMQSCDYSPDLHRASWNAVVHACEGIPPAFAQPFYGVFCNAELWRPFPDCEAVLRTLRVAGIVTGIVSNIGWDILPCLAANRMTELIDTVVQSFRAGRLKPDGEMFLTVLRNLRIEPARALMVGDNWRTDGAAAAVGIATLVLPMSPANRRLRGLDIVLRTAGIELLLRESYATLG